MHVHIVDHNTLHLERLETMVKSLLPKSTLTKARTHDDHTQHAQNADLIIISGGTWLVHKNPGTHRRLMNGILSYEKPIFAICLGAEATAHFFGAKVKEMEHRQQGITEIEITNRNVAQKIGNKNAMVYEYHKWAITDLPESLQALAISNCGIEYFRHKTLPIFGTQFHPEVRKKNNDGYLFFEHSLREMKLS
jgi:GMP synthase-like glutamine amidotransferase